MPPYQTSRFGPAYDPPPFSQVLAATLIAVVLLLLVVYVPVLLRWYRISRAARRERVRRQTIVINLRRSEMPQFAALSPSRRDHVHAAMVQLRLIGSMRYAGRGKR